VHRYDTQRVLRVRHDWIVKRAVRRFALIALALVACGAWAQPSPGERYEEAVRDLLASPAGLAFLEAYMAIQRDYLYGADREALFEGALVGLVEALGDPFTHYLDPEAAAADRARSAASAVEIAQIGDVGFVRISTFEGESVGARFTLALDTLLANGAQGIVLDLRGNTGGSVLQGLQVLDRFLSEGELGFRRVRGVSVPIAYANPRSVAVPLVVLVDADTASTAEIVAGVLQTYGRARLIGTTTAGKGVGQTAIRLTDGGELRLVSFEWLLPGLRSIDTVGLTPDILVSALPDDPVSDGPGRPLVFVPDDIGDVPLRLALEVLRALIGDELAQPAPAPASRPGAATNGAEPEAPSRVPPRPPPVLPPPPSTEAPDEGAGDDVPPPPLDEDGAAQAEPA
jgi:C-terminal processing protease CtpA/Prc